jgi:tRNA/rRNA methyltransferase
MEADLFPYEAVRVVLVSPRNPLNIGAVARAMSNFGLRRLRLVCAYDVAYKEARSAVGAAPVLESAETFEALAAAVADCSLVVGTTSVAHRELHHPLRRLEYGARLIRKHLAIGPIALVFGSEKYGLSNEDMAHCHWLLRIPTRREHGSMNLGQAAAVCFYELLRNPRAASGAPKQHQPAASGDLERLARQLAEVLEVSGYVQPRTARSTALKTQRLIRRMALSARDAETWLGMLRQIRWKMESG